MSRLDEILDHKRREIAEAKANISAAGARSLAAGAPPPRPFIEVLKSRSPAIIAEIKYRSPSAGVFRTDFNPTERAVLYAKSGAAALSILTDSKYFGGSFEIFTQVRSRVEVPCLAKDFFLDEHQLYLARAAGADAFLLIARALPTTKLKELYQLGKSLGMDCLFEIHDQDELEAASETGANLVGINNRNLADFSVDLGTSEKLAPQLPEGAVVAALSGVSQPADIERLSRVGINIFLIGEALSRADDPAKKMAELLAVGSAES